jgi:hypothetical protein
VQLDSVLGPLSLLGRLLTAGEGFGEPQRICAGRGSLLCQFDVEIPAANGECR